MAKPSQLGASATEEEPSFPRGGASSITPLKRRQIRAEAQAEAEKDFFAGVSAGDPANSKRRKKSGKQAHAQGIETSFLARELAHGKAPAFVELLKFKTCNVGARVWGVVSDVTHHGVTVSLPDGLKGHVSVEEACDASFLTNDKSHKPPALADLFHVGQLVRAIIIGLDQQPRAGASNSKSGKKTIRLSLQVSKVNSALTSEAVQRNVPLPACVTSVEDHGYTLSFGIKGITGFLSKKHQGSGKKEDAAGLKPGMLIECVAHNQKAKQKTVKVTAAASVVTDAVTEDYAGLSIGALLPGALVDAQVTNLVSDGLVLSFLTFFSGTVDQFHLPQASTGADWKKQYSKDQRVKARILYVDPSSKKIKLSLHPELLDLILGRLPAVGQTYENIVVKRIDEGLGLVLEVPSEPTASPGFVHISNTADTKVDKLQQAYRVGQKVKGRVIGARPLDGLSVLSLKPTVVEQQVASIAEVKPGSLMSGTISSIADYGMLVALAPGIRALVPAVHMANTVGRRSVSKYKEGQEVTGRILEVDSAKKRVSMTLKKLLCSDKLPTITTFKDAGAGLRSYGYITGIKAYGIFVSFFGGMKGLAHTAELPLAPEQSPKDAYQVGQVVKCRILSTDFSHQRLKLSLMGKKSGTEGSEEIAGGEDPWGGLQPGDVVHGKVREIESTEVDGESAPSQYVIDIEGGSHGHLGAGHLADHPAAVAALQGAVKVGDPLGPLLVLERVEASGFVRLSRKASLISAAASIPKAVAMVKETMILPGYITGITNDACYVRFLGQLTGRAGLAQLADSFVSDPSQHYTVGQSVRAQVVQVDSAKERFTVTLKQSLVGASDAAYLQSLFHDLEFAEKLRASSDPDAADQVDWDKDFVVGSVVDASVHEQKDYGLVFDFAAHADVLGLAAKHQTEGPSPSPGAPLKARILDVSKDTGIVDVTLKPTLIEASAAAAVGSRGEKTEEGGKGDNREKKTKKRKAEEALDAAHAADSSLKVGQMHFKAVVELVKDDYLVLSLPTHKHAFGFAAICDYNIQEHKSPAPFQVGQQVQARVAALPSKHSGGRLVMHIPLLTDAQAAKKSAKKPSVSQGELMKGQVTFITPTHMDITLDSGAKGRVCLCEVQEAEAAAKDGAKGFGDYTVGQSVEAVCFGQTEGFEGRKLGLLDLSVRPVVIAAAEKKEKVGQFRSRGSSLKPGKTVFGYVQEVADEHVVVQISSALKGRISILDSADEPDKLSSFAQQFAEGQPIQCRVSQVDRHKNQADLTLRDIHNSSKISSATAAGSPVGTVLLGQVVTASNVLVRVHVGRRTYGTVALTDIHDGWVDKPAQGITKGLYVKCCVVAKAHGQEANKLQLSLQASKGGAWPGQGSAQQSPAGASLSAVTGVSQLKEGQQVCGYVQHVAKAGMFVTLSHHVTARVKLGQLAGSFVEDPEAVFPPGTLVKGRILSIQGDRVEMTLKDSQEGSWTDLSQLKKGDIVKAKVKRLEAFGAFVELHNSALTGLAHISEVSDDYVKNIQDVLQVGQGVRAVVLDVDMQQRRLSLGLKASYFTDAGDAADTEEDAQASDIEEEMAEMDSAADSDVEAAQLLPELAGLRHMDASDEEEAEEGHSDTASSADEDIDNLDDDSDASTGESEGGKDEGTAGIISGSTDRNPAAVKKRKTGAETNGLGSVGWDASDEEEDQAVPVPTEVELLPAKKASKAQKKREKEEHERQIREQELARVSESSSQPESAEDFERLVMGKPNSSMVWIQYMAFLISLGEIEKARATAERGLATINYREEGEKFNIWQAWLNLENMYGSPTPDEAVTRLFQKALPYCNAKKLYLALLDILERTNKDELAEQTLKAMCRKFSESAKIWLRHISWLLTKDRADAARKVLDKSFAALPQRKHIKVISQTAIQEFKVGSAERGRSMFESCLRNYPARLDVWSQYLDQEIKLGDKQRIEALFERATHMQLPPKKMKFLFKRYLQYEQEHGDAAAVAHVKKQALDFVQQHMSS